MCLAVQTGIWRPHDFFATAVRIFHFGSEHWPVEFRQIFYQKRFQSKIMSTYHELGVVFLPQKDLTPSAPSWKALYAAALQSNCALLQSKWPGEENEKTKKKSCSLLYDLLKVTTEIRATPSDAKERVWEEAALREHTSSTNSNCLPIPPCSPWLTTRPTRTNNRIQETKHTQTKTRTRTRTRHCRTPQTHNHKTREQQNHTDWQFLPSQTQQTIHRFRKEEIIENKQKPVHKDNRSSAWTQQPPDWSDPAAGAEDAKARRSLKQRIPPSVAKNPRRVQNVIISLLESLYNPLCDATKVDHQKKA